MSLQDIPSCLQGIDLLAALAGMGLALGVLTGLFGIGGGILAVPLLNTVLGVPYPLAVGSSLSFVIGTSAAGAMRHFRMGNVDLRAAVTLSAGSIFGAVAGAWLHHHLAQSLPGFERLMDALFILLLLTVAELVWLNPQDGKGRRTLLQRLPIGPRMDLIAGGVTSVSVPGLALMGLIVGLVTGMMGVGGGVLFMPILLIVVGLKLKQAVGTSLAAVLLAAVAGTVFHGFGQSASIWIAMSLLVGSLVGVQFGAWLSGRIHARSIQRYFALLALAVAAFLAYSLIVNSNSLP